jgi:phosphohistidine phosphatase SixA
MRRRKLISLSVLSFLLWPMGAAASEAEAWAALRSGAVALIRHANAPGTGDPPGMRLGECRTQRNLDDRGRAQAARIGARFAEQGVSIGTALTSEWCRAIETAALAFPGKGRAEPAFNSFFDERAREPAQSMVARRIIADWRGPGALVAVTHQVNITALTGVIPGSGEAVVVRMERDKLAVVGRIPF